MRELWGMEEGGVEGEGERGERSYWLSFWEDW